MAIDPLLRRLNELSWPTVAFDQPDPVPGQLWRAEWDGTACLVVVAGKRAGRTIPVVAASSDHVGDETALVAKTKNGMTLCVWAGLARTIKTFTLDHRISDLTIHSFDLLTGVTVGADQGAWAPITSNLDDRVLIRTDLTEDLDHLSEIEWIPESGGETTTLATVTKEAGFRPSQIARLLNITSGDARRLLQGKREPSEEEAHILTDVLGSPTRAAIRFDDRLVAELDQPGFRPPLRLIAHKTHGGDETAARRAVAGEVMSLAARHRDREPRNWAVLISELLDAS